MFSAFHLSYVQFGQQVQWSEDGNAIAKVVAGEIVQEMAADPQQRSVLATNADLTPTGGTSPLAIRRFSLSEDGSKIADLKCSNLKI